MVIAFRINVANDWQQYGHLPPADPPSRSQRILVFAPHCDDETLGCGGMMSMAEKAGARVRVVLITNGDGFRFGVARTYRTIRVTPQKCISYAHRRQKETLAALRELGISSGNVVFLGYPDRGIAQLWNTHWEHTQLYKSPATGYTRSPYSNSYTPKAPYCGESLLSDIQRVLAQEKPTDVYVPHPLDNHQDHYATYCFVTAAITQLTAENQKWASQIRVHTYLVHRGDWPIPKGDHPHEPLVPPHGLAGGETKWQALALPPEIVEAKRGAIRSYRSQTAIERNFLTSFARTNELFGDLPVRKMADVPNGAITVDGRPEDWLGTPPAVIDPIGDLVLASMDKSGDVRDVYMASDDDYIYIRVDCARRLSKRMTYLLTLRGVSDRETDNRFSAEIRPPKRAKPAGVIWAYRNNVLEIAAPKWRFSSDQTLFVQVQTRLGRIRVENTGTHEVAVGK